MPAPANSRQVAAQAPKHEPEVRERLIALSKRAKNGDYTAARGCFLLGVSFSSLFALYVVGIFALSVGTIATLPGILIALVSLAIPLTIGAAVSLGIAAIVRVVCRSIHRKHYLATWRELFTTNMMQMVVDEEYTRLLKERADDIWTLKWFAPPLPKTMEQQLELAACYQLALRRMIRGVSRLDNGPLWQGGIAYHAGTRSGVSCGCLLFLPLNWLAIGLWIIAGIYFIHRCAAIAAYCDFLLHEEE